MLKLARSSSTTSQLSAVHRGAAFEAKCMRLLQENFSMSLQSVGGASDGGVDLQGWWWLPTSDSPPVTHDPAHYRRLRILAQCKAEKKKTGPAYLREMEGVLHRHTLGAIQVAGSSSEQASATFNHYPTIGLFLSMSPFTKQALLRAHSSPFPFCLVHLPEADPVEISADEDETVGNGYGSIMLNQSLAHGVLHGEIEARLEHPSRIGDIGRPGLWWNGQRIPSWTPDNVAVDVDGDSVSSVCDSSAEHETRCP